MAIRLIIEIKYPEYASVKLTDDNIKLLTNNNPQLKNPEQELLTSTNNNLIITHDSQDELIIRPELQIKEDSKLFGFNPIVLMVSFFAFMLVLNFISSHIGWYDYDVKAHSLIVYPKNQPVTKVDVINPIDYFNSEGDYQKLYDDYIDYGYTKADIDRMFLGLNSTNYDALKKLDIEFDLSTNNVQNGDTITITTNYNDKKARQNKINITNAQFEYQINDLPSYVTKDNTTIKDFNNIEVTQILDESNITFDHKTLTHVYQDPNDESSIILEYKLTGGIKDGRFSNQEIDNMFIKVDAIIINDELNLSNEKVIDSLDDNYIQIH